MSDNRRSQAEMFGRRPRVDRGTVEGTPHAQTSGKACDDPNRQPFEVTMEEVLSRENMLAAHTRVMQNGGAPGIDGITVDDLWDMAVDQWEAIREKLLRGYFSLSMATGGGPGWTDAFLWNVIPAGIGNILGGSLLVALPFWFAFRHRLPARND